MSDPLFEESVLRTPNGRVALRIYNPDARVTLLALHGWLDNCASWLPLARTMPDVRILAPDWPGHGHSDHFPASYTHHFVDSVFTLHDILRAIPDVAYGKILLTGHSMGAGMAALYAGTFPERISKLIMIESSGPSSQEPESVTQGLRRSVRYLARLKSLDPNVYPDLESAVAARDNIAPIDDVNKRLLAIRAIREEPGGYRYAIDQKFKTPSAVRMSEEFVGQFIAAIECPVLLITASNPLPAVSRYLPQRIPLFRNLRHEIVPGHHHLHMDNPAETARIIRSFLDRPEIQGR